MSGAGRGRVLATDQMEGAALTLLRRAGLGPDGGCCPYLTQASWPRTRWRVLPLPYSGVLASDQIAASDGPVPVVKSFDQRSTGRATVLPTTENASPSCLPMSTRKQVRLWAAAQSRRWLLGPTQLGTTDCLVPRRVRRVRRVSRAVPGGPLRDTPAMAQIAQLQHSYCWRAAPRTRSSNGPDR